jgi:hypothetical protein
MTLRVFQTSEQQLYIRCSSGIYLFIFQRRPFSILMLLAGGCIIRNVSPTFVQCFFFLLFKSARGSNDFFIFRFSGIHFSANGPAGHWASCWQSILEVMIITY